MAISNDDKFMVEVLIDKLLKIKENPRNAEELFSYYGSSSPNNSDYSFHTFAKEEGTRLFNLIPFVIKPKDKVNLNKIFVEEKINDEQSIFYIAARDNITLSVKHKINYTLLRQQLMRSYETLYHFPGLRDKMHDLYYHTPGVMYNSCLSLRHYKLLNKTMQMPVEVQDGNKKINYKISVLTNLLEISNKHPESLDNGLVNKLLTKSHKDFKSLQEKAREDILNWANEEILKNENHNKLLINSAVSLLLCNGYSAKKLKECGYPDVDWQSNIHTKEQIYFNNKKKTGIFLRNHYYNVVKSKSINLLKKDYILQPEDWVLSRRLHLNSLSSTAKQKETIDKILNNSLKTIDKDYKTPEGDIGDSLFPLNEVKVVVKDGRIIASGTRIDYKEEWLNRLTKHNYDIYEIKEHNDKKYSIFTNAFLTEEFGYSYMAKKEVELIQYYRNAPPDNVEIIKDFFEHNIKDIIKSTLSSLFHKGNIMKSSLSTGVKIPLLEFLIEFKEITPKIADETLKAFEESKEWQEVNAKSSDAVKTFALSILTAKANIETYQTYFKVKKNIESIELPGEESNDIEDSSFKI